MDPAKFDYIYGKLLSNGFSVERSKQLAKSLYMIAEDLKTTPEHIVKYVTPQGVRFDNNLYDRLNAMRTNSSQIGFIDKENIPQAILNQIP